jgi:hypothetical protein
MTEELGLTDQKVNAGLYNNLGAPNRMRAPKFFHYCTSHCFSAPRMLISSSSPSVSADESETRDFGRPSFEGECEWFERLGRRSGVRGGCEEVRLRTGENDRDSSRLLTIVRPIPGVPLVARVFGSVSGSGAAWLRISTKVNIRCMGRRTLVLLLLL